MPTASAFPYPPCPFRIDAAAASDVGKMRENNEDRVIVADLASGVAIAAGAEASAKAEAGAWLAAVCDGMGGENGGEIASALTIDAVLRSMLVARGAVGDLLADALRGSIRHASHAVHARAQQNPALSRMGTTATVAALGDSELLIGQVGGPRQHQLHRRAFLATVTARRQMSVMNVVST